MTPTELLFAAAIAAGILGVLSGHHKELVMAATILMLVITLVDMWGVSIITVILAAALLILFTAMRLLGEVVISLANTAMTDMDEPNGAAGLDTAAVKVDQLLGEEPPKTDGGDTDQSNDDPGDGRKPVVSAFIESITGFASIIGTLLHGNRGDSNR
jgi:hypothetical protein